MKKEFKTIDELRAWLKPMRYLEFWYAIEPYNLPLYGQDKPHCDERIRGGGVTEETVLYCLKQMARLELTQRYGLQNRRSTPWLRVVK